MSITSSSMATFHFQGGSNPLELSSTNQHNARKVILAMRTGADRQWSAGGRGGKFSLCVGIVVAVVVLMLPVQAGAADVEELVRHIDQLWRGKTSHATMSMTVKTQRYQRSMTMEAWSKGKEYSLVVIQQPIKDKGIATLKVKENIWNYLPKINRVTKVPSSMMSGSWMGSHFTNDDLVKESTFEDDYSSKISFEGNRDGHDIYELSFIPKENAAVVWGKVVMNLDRTTLAPYDALYYDEEGQLVRSMRFDQPKKVQDRVIPMRMILQPTDKPDESTVIVYKAISFDVDIDENYFSLQRLKSRR